MAHIDRAIVRPPINRSWMRGAVRVTVTGCLAATVALGSTVARADDRPPLRYDLRVDGAITAAALVVWGGGELLKGQLGPARCRWCGSDPLDDGVRDGLRWTGHAGAADTASNVTAYLLAPATALGLTALAAAHDDRLGEIWIDALLTTQAVALAGDLNQVVKFAVGRQRPYAHAATTIPGPAANRDDNLSFYSGHTSATTSIAAAAGTIASLRGYRWAPAIWIAGGAVAAVTGYLRIAADKHYLTDVLTGAALGATVGVAVPYAFHRPLPGDAGGAGPRLTLAPLPGGIALRYRRPW